MGSYGYPGIWIWNYQYTVMFHYCITGEYIIANDIQFSPGSDASGLARTIMEDFVQKVQHAKEE